MAVPDAIRIVSCFTAGDTLLIVDGSGPILIHGDCLDLAGILAGTPTADNGCVGADSGTGSALLTLGLVDVRHMILVKGDGSEPTGILASVCQTATAGVGNFITTHRAFIASRLDYLDHVRIAGISAHSELHAISKNCALLVYTAAHGRRIARNNLLRNIQHFLQQRVIPRQLRNLTQNFILQVLNLCIKFSHNILLIYCMCQFRRTIRNG